MKTPINLNYLVAATICASRDKARRNLMGVHADITAAGTLFVATDGHRMAVLFDEQDQDADHMNVLASATIPLRLCKKIKRSPAVPKKWESMLEIDGDTVRVTARGVTYETAAVASEYPDWRKIVPTKLTGEASTFNGKYLADFAKISRIISGAKFPPEISHNGNDACIVHLGYPGRAFGVLMPFRNTPSKWSAPEWAELKEGEKK